MALEKDAGDNIGNDLVFLVIGLMGILGIAIGLYVFVYKNQQEKEKDEKEEKPAERKLTRKEERAARRLRNRKNRRGMGNVQETEVETKPEEEGAESDGDGDEGNDGAGLSDGEENYDGLTEKQMRRAIKKKEKRQEREARSAVRQQREEQLGARSQAYADKQAEKEAQRLEKQREAQKRADEQRQQAEKEFDQWKDLISVEEAGSNVQNVEDESQDMLLRFIQHIQEQKVVMLEELAVTFNLRTQEAINRLESLEKMGRITGVFDDRGKFIYITREEMSQVAKFITNRGRISISELAKESNKLIDLASKPAKQESADDKNPAEIEIS